VIGRPSEATIPSSTLAPSAPITATLNASGGQIAGAGTVGIGAPVGVTAGSAVGVVPPEGGTDVGDGVGQTGVGVRGRIVGTTRVGYGVGVG
jgi:hypothetical protein